MKKTVTAFALFSLILAATSPLSSCGTTVEWTVLRSVPDGQLPGWQISPAGGGNPVNAYGAGVLRAQVDLAAGAYQIEGGYLDAAAPVEFSVDADGRVKLDDLDDQITAFASSANITLLPDFAPTQGTSKELRDTTNKLTFAMNIDSINQTIMKDFVAIIQIIRALDNAPKENQDAFRSALTSLRRNFTASKASAKRHVTTLTDPLTGLIKRTRRVKSLAAYQLLFIRKTGLHDVQSAYVSSSKEEEKLLNFVILLLQEIEDVNTGAAEDVIRGILSDIRKHQLKGFHRQTLIFIKKLPEADQGAAIQTEIGIKEGLLDRLNNLVLTKEVAQKQRDSSMELLNSQLERLR